SAPGALTADLPVAVTRRTGRHCGSCQRRLEGRRLMSLRAGVLGLGVMGRNHARVLSNLDGVKLVGVFDPSPDTPDRVHDCPVVHDLESFIKLGLDYAVVAAPTAFHLEMGTRL